MARNESKKKDEERNFTGELHLDTDVAPAGSFSLEEILAEYSEDGGETPSSAATDANAEPDTPAGGETPPAPSADASEPPLPFSPSDVPPPPRPVSIEKAVGQTVGDLMGQAAEEDKAAHPRKGLFSRKKWEETEQLYAPPGPPPDPEPEEPPLEEEPLEDAARIALKVYRRLRRPLPAAFFAAAAFLVPQALEYAGYAVPLWTEDATARAGISAAFLLLMCGLCRAVFYRGFSRLFKKRFTGELMMSAAALAALLDCAASVFLPERSAAPLYALPACVGLLFGQWGCVQREKGRSDTLRTAALDAAPPYLVTDLDDGACKQPGRTPGFWTDVETVSLSEVWQSALLPVIFVATVVFAVLTSVGQKRPADFLLNWSAILAAASALILPLTDTLPAAQLAKRLQKAGCAVAGCAGAEKISRKKRMIITDRDLFPPGSVSLNGVKLFGEEMSKAVSYGASLARASDCGLRRLFDNLLVSEGGKLEVLDDFSFYEEGGFSAGIRGEGVLMGTASFMRKMGVRLPSGLNLRTGVFLAVDKQLSAVFAVKYNPAENVDWALKLLRRNHITPVLTSRDPNVNPALLKRKFTAKVRVEYPELSARLALSEQETAHGRPRALLLREGLLPYAETVAGSQRLTRAVRSGTALALLGSVTGALLAFYLTGLESYALMEPLRLLLFLLLWALPVFLVDSLAGRY